jgi:alkanesulfonate monooxygenase SsuD/methylene tetrahydromethanopterin reductase-like flavin-dependent oxidoreductase (luciferase family)
VWSSAWKPDGHRAVTVVEMSVGLRRLGFFTYLGGTRDPGSLFAETIELFVAAERLGFDSVWVAQHHFGPLVGALPSPLPFLAAVAARTRWIRLGTAVVILPLEHPVRLAEDAAVVDLLSGGRLELGLGSGTDPAAFTALGFDPERRRDLMGEGLGALLGALRGEPLPTGHVVRPRAPGLERRVWQGVFSPERAREAAAAGTHVLLPRALPGDSNLAAGQQARAATAFLEAWSWPWPGQVALSRPVYPSTDAAAARSELADELRFQVEQANRFGTRAGAGDLDVEGFLDAGVFHIGSVADVLHGLRDDPALPLATELICQVGHLGPGFHHTMRALELIATEVAPALGWRPRRD